jgi:hypothetical protein
MIPVYAICLREFAQSQIGEMFSVSGAQLLVVPTILGHDAVLLFTAREKAVVFLDSWQRKALGVAVSFRGSDALIDQLRQIDSGDTNCRSVAINPEAKDQHVYERIMSITDYIAELRN